MIATRTLSDRWGLLIEQAELTDATAAWLPEPAAS